jgi:hypothetical protein
VENLGHVQRRFHKCSVVNERNRNIPQHFRREFRRYLQLTLRNLGKNALNTYLLMISERVTDNRRKNSNKRARGKQSTVGTGESPDNNTHHIHTRGRDSETARHGRQQSDTGNGLLTTPSRCLHQSAGSPAALFPPPLAALFHAI